MDSDSVLVVSLTAKDLDYNFYENFKIRPVGVNYKENSYSILTIVNNHSISNSKNWNEQHYYTAKPIKIRINGFVDKIYFEVLDVKTNSIFITNSLQLASTSLSESYINNLNISLLNYFMVDETILVEPNIDNTLPSLINNSYKNRHIQNSRELLDYRVIPKLSSAQLFVCFIAFILAFILRTVKIKFT